MNPAFAHPGRTTTKTRLIPAALAALLLLAGCGGGGGAPSIGARPGTPVGQPPQPPVDTPPDPIPSKESVFGTYWNMCAAPRTGVDAEGTPYPDRQGTLLDELRFLRGWADAYYLWYNEIPNSYRMADFKNALDYFKVLKTPLLTPSGQPKDKYHFTYPTAEWEKLTNSGIDLSYGVTWSRSTGPNLPRTWLATVIEPGSPAAAAGLRRGDLLLTVDGIDFVNAGDQASVDKINAGLFPETVGEVHRFGVRRAGANIEVTMVAAEVKADPVKNVKVIETPAGKVGYLTFSSHNAVAEKELIDAFTQLRDAGVSDLVLDMRYNGGGLLYVASQLAYMVAGPASAGRVFDRPQYNDKTPVQPAIPFRSTAWGFSSPNPAPRGMALPYLGLKRVTVLSTAGTCSASEAVINGLRGIDVEVNVIGGQTCGKPYAFTPVPNCGTTYFSIEFKGVNEKGFGDYADGMAPTCNVQDDLSREVGDPSEGMLAAALQFNATRSCPAATATARARTAPLQLVRPEAAEIAVMTRP